MHFQMSENYEDIFYSNISNIIQTEGLRSHQKDQTYTMPYQLIRDECCVKTQVICKVHTDLNVSDPLTELLPRAKHDHHQMATP